MSARAHLERRLVERTGIELGRGGMGRALTRHLERRLRELGLSTLGEYQARLEVDALELEQLINAITVVHSWFFRDPGQLAAIEAALTERRADAEPLRVWVAGCASGEDVYSIAMLADRLGRSVDVLGTDVNSHALECARNGRYSAWSVRELGARFGGYVQSEGSSFRVSDAIRKRVRFERHNLMDAPPAASRGGWDVILCRNVLIYFVREQARRVFERLIGALSRGGLLLLGASEVVFDVPPTLETIYVAQRLAFRRVDDSRPPAPKPNEAAGRARAVTERRPPLPALPRRAEALAPVRAVRQHESAPQALLAAAHALLDGGEPGSARELYLRAVALDPTCPQARLYAGIAHYLCGAIEAALAELRAAALLEPRSWVAAFYSALCYESLGLSEDAVREYQNVVRFTAWPDAASLGGPSVLGAWKDDLIALARTRVCGPRV